MTTEEKNLLLQDLCGRLPYGVKVSVTLMDSQGNMGRIDTELKPAHMSYLYSVGEQNCHWKDVKPYLRPMSSMTDKEEDEYEIIIRSSLTTHIDWLNKNMFDYRGLIWKGLAIAVIPENNPNDILI